MARRRAALLVLTLLLAPAGPAGAEDRIGVASAVKNQVVGTVSGRARNLRTGNGVFQNEAVATGSSSSAQLLFRDKTSLSVGEKSRVVLDRFIYDPRRSTSEALLNVTKGSFRFISGAVKRKRYRLKVPGAHIGVRGTIVEGYIDDRLCPPGGGAESSSGPECRISCAVLVESAFVLEPDAPGRPDVLVDKPGDFVCILPDGGTIGPLTWKGPFLDLGAGQQFFANYVRQTLSRGGNVLPEFRNDPIDSRNLDKRFPPPPPPPPPTKSSTPPPAPYQPNPPVIKGEQGTITGGEQRSLSDGQQRSIYGIRP